MSKYATIKCWHLSDAVTDPKIIAARPQSLLLIKKSILKLGYRAFAVDAREDVEKQVWYTLFVMGEEVRFYIDGSGFYRLVNCDLTENELYFERLNVPVGHKPWVFYSWQSDHNSSRSAIGDALKEAVEHINTKLAPREKLLIVESTRAEDGAKNIVAAIQDNLDKCMFAIFDITNVATVKVDAGQGVETVKAAEAPKKAEVDVPKANGDAKSYPNANVVFELSYALVRKQPDQILLAKKGRKADFKEDGVPFDFEHNRRIDFDRPAKIKNDLKEILISYFRRVNYIKAD